MKNMPGEIIINSQPSIEGSVPLFQDPVINMFPEYHG